MLVEWHMTIINNVKHGRLNHATTYMYRLLRATVSFSSRSPLDGYSGSFRRLKLEREREREREINGDQGQ